MTDQELRDVVATLSLKHLELADSQAELAKSQKETDRQIRELGKQIGGLGDKFGSFAERSTIAEAQRETDRQIRELGKQIGGLGDKFGSFTEGLALPSMTKILGKRFGMDVIAPGLLSRKNGTAMELDVFAWSKNRDEAYVVEVKSHLRDEALDQMRKTLQEFRGYFPDYAEKKLYGIIAAVHIPERMRERVLKEGFYLARIHDGQFELEVPNDFQPREF